METNGEHPALSVHNLSVTLEGQVVLKDVSFEIYPGESLAIIGPNGSGKTTLFRALIGSIPHTGEVHWGPGARLGYVPQKLDIERNLPLSLGDFLKSRSSGYEAVNQSQIEESLSLVHLSKFFLKRPIGELSGGQFQRALVAFALLGNPTLLLLDEPTAGIDLPGEEQIYETTKRLQDEKRLTVITISHDLSLVHIYADKVLCLNKTNLCFGEPIEVLTQETLTKLYGSPHQFYHHPHNPHL